MEEDDIVMRVGNSLVQRRTNEEGRGCKPKELIRRCQGLADVPLRAPGACTQVRGKKYPYSFID